MIAFSLFDFCGVLEVVAIIFWGKIWINLQSESLKVNVLILLVAKGEDIWIKDARTKANTVQLYMWFFPLSFEVQKGRGVYMVLILLLAINFSLVLLLNLLLTKYHEQNKMWNISMNEKLMLVVLFFN